MNPRRGWGILGSVFRRGESGLRAWAMDGGSGDWVVLMDRVASVFQSDQVRQLSRAAPGSGYRCSCAVQVTAPTMVLLPPVSNHKSFDIFDIKFNNLFFKKNCANIIKFKLFLKKVVLIKEVTVKEVIFCINF